MYNYDQLMPNFHIDRQQTEFASVDVTDHHQVAYSTTTSTDHDRHHPPSRQVPVGCRSNPSATQPSACSWPSSSSSSNSTSPSSSCSSSSARLATTAVTGAAESLASGRAKTTGNGVVLFNLPPLVNNSTLVRQRASAKDQLAAATVTTGASLPLMIGGRSRCVLNILEGPNSAHQQTQAPADQQLAVPHEEAKGPLSPGVSGPLSGPKNTALRAEQRRTHNHASVSVVRPVMNTTRTAHYSSHQHARTAQFEDSGPLWQPTSVIASDTCSNSMKSSIVDDLMSLESRINSSKRSALDIGPIGNAGRGHATLDELLMSSSRFGGFVSLHQHHQDQQLNEQTARQQAILYRREEYELNRRVRRQHQFVLSKIEQRKRDLRIIRSVWLQKDFKHAIEKLVDLYHQGLIFTTTDDHNQLTSLEKQPQQQQQQTTLSSLNTSLVVDVVSVIILRPKLWTLDVCQLLLPIMVNDLLMQRTKYENYIEVGLKSLKLILTHFSSLIKTTIESQKESASRLAGGVDLSREDRLNKCLNCYKLLLEARSLVSKRSQAAGAGSKLAGMYRELQQSFCSLQLA